MGNVWRHRVGRPAPPVALPVAPPLLRRCARGNTLAARTRPIGSFDAYDPSFTGGVFVAAGDINGDGFKDIITAPGPGIVPLVRVFSGATGLQIREFGPYDPSFMGGVRVAAGDFDRDGSAEMVTATGPGIEGRVRVWSGTGVLFASASLPSFVNDFIPYPGFTGGVNVAVGDVNGDGVPDIITAAGPGGGPHIRVFNGVNGNMVLEFFAYEASFTGGVNVSVGDVNGDGRYEIITAPVSGRPAEIKAFDGRTGALREVFNAYPNFNGGAFVGGVRQ